MVLILTFINVDSPPSVSCRGMLETAGIMMSERSIHYDMSKFYPGLQLRVGPTAVGGGILEFHMDSNVRYDERHDDVPSTGEMNKYTINTAMKCCPSAHEMLKFSFVFK